MDNEYIEKVSKVKWDIIRLVNEYNEIAVLCYERGDLKGHAYWTDRAFDLLDDRAKIGADLKRSNKMGA